MGSKPPYFSASETPEAPEGFLFRLSALSHLKLMVLHIAASKTHSAFEKTGKEILYGLSTLI